MTAFKNFQIPVFWARLAAVFGMVAILYSSTQPSPRVRDIDQTLMDHVLDFAHFPIYFFLTIFMIFAFESFKKRSFVAAFCVASFFGILNEFVQINAPGRSFSVKDMIVNASAAFLAVMMVYFQRKKIS